MVWLGRRTDVLASKEDRCAGSEEGGGGFRTRRGFAGAEGTLGGGCRGCIIYIYIYIYIQTKFVCALRPLCFVIVLFHVFLGGLMFVGAGQSFWFVLPTFRKLLGALDFLGQQKLQLQLSVRCFQIVHFPRVSLQLFAPPHCTEKSCSCSFLSN